MSSAPSAAEIKKETVTTPAKLPGVLDDRIVAYTPEQFEFIKNAEQKKIEALEKQFGVYQTNIEKLIAQFTPKMEAATVPSSPTGSVAGPSAFKKESYDNAVAALDAIIRKKAKYAAWEINKEEMMKEWGWKHEYEKPGKYEAITMTAPLQYSRQIIGIPGGRFRIPLRQYADIQNVQGADRHIWYTGDSFDFEAITEGTAPGDTTVTLTQVSAIPATRGKLIKINYSDTEKAPASIIDYVNSRGTLAAIDDESNEILNVGTTVSSPTNWVNGNTGAAITADTTFNTAHSLTLTGVAKARQLIDAQGMGPGGYILALGHKAYFDLLISSGIDKLVQQGVPQMTIQGVIETLAGCQLVVAKTQAGGDSTSKRAFMFTAGQTMGLSVQRELNVEADRRNELQQIYVTPTQRIKSAVLDEKSSCRISTAA